MKHLDEKTGRLSRRALLQTSAGAVALGGVAAPFVLRGARAAGGFDPKRFSGQSIEVLLAKGPRADLLQKYEKEFTELTGIKVGSEQVPEQQQRQKAVIEFTSGSTSFDVLMLALHVQKRLVAKGKWLVDLRSMLADPQAHLARLRLRRLLARPACSGPPRRTGAIDTLPINIDYHLIYSNMDLFEKKGVAYPDTFDEMVAAAKALHDPANGITGWVEPRHQERQRAGLDQPAARLGRRLDRRQGVKHTTRRPGSGGGRALQDPQRRVRPGRRQRLQLDGGQASFMQGRAAMWLDGIGFAVPVEDKTKSRVAGRVKYVHAAQGPQGPAFGQLRRRHGRLGLHREEGGGLFSTASGRPARRWRRASCRAAIGAPGRTGGLRGPCRAGRHHLVQGRRSRPSSSAARSAGRACRWSSRSPSSATSSAWRSPT